MRELLSFGANIENKLYFCVLIKPYKNKPTMQTNLNILVIYHRSDKALLQRLLWERFNKLSNNDANKVSMFYKELNNTQAPKSEAAQTLLLSNDSYLHETAHIIIPIISTDFLATDFCVDYEDLYLQWHKMGEKQIVPILWLACLIADTPLGKLPLLHKDFVPLAKNPARNTVISSLIDNLQQIIAQQSAQQRGIIFATKTTKSNANYHLLAIGIDDYPNFNHLENAVKDAQAVVKTLTDGYLFAPENNITLYNHQATRKEIETQLRSLVTKVKPTDCVLIYYAGHGWYDTTMDEGHWLPYDAYAATEEGFIDNTISNTDIIKFIKKINSLHTFLISDSCFSGTLFEQSTRNVGAFLQKVESEPSRWALTSGRKEVVADGIPGEHSPFAQALMDILENKLNDKIMVSDIIRYVKEVVGNKNNQQPVGDRLRDVGGTSIGEFVLYKETT